MRIADRMDNIYGRSTFHFYRVNCRGPEPMDIGNIPIRRKFVKLSLEEKEQAQGGKQVLCMPEGWLFCQATQQAKTHENSKKLVEPLKATDTKNGKTVQ